MMNKNLFFDVYLPAILVTLLALLCFNFPWIMGALGRLLATSAIGLVYLGLCVFLVLLALAFIAFILS